MRYIEQRCSQLRAEVLHGERSGVESWKCCHGLRISDDHAGSTHRMRADASRRELLQQRLAVRHAQVHAQRQRRSGVSCLEYRFPTLGMVAAHPLDPPARIGPARDVVGPDRFADRRALAQVAPQERVDECLRTRTHQRTGGEHCAVDDGERRCSRVIELVERDSDERAQQRIGDRLADEDAGDCVQRAPMPQRAVSKFLHQRASAQRGAVVDLGKRFAKAHAAENARDRARCLHLLIVHRTAFVSQPRRRTAHPARLRARRRTLRPSSRVHPRAAVR